MSNSNSPTGPLSVGNVVSAGLRIYRDRFKTFFGISLIATLWALLPLLISFAYETLPLPDSSGLTWLRGITEFGMTIYCTAKFILNLALISRLTFGILTNEIETVQTARNKINSLMWRFLVAQFLVGLIMFGVALLIFTLMFLSIFLVSQIPSGELIVALLFIPLFLGGLAIYIRYYSRYFIPEVTLALETNLTARQSVDRSWELTKGSVVRIQGIVVVAFLITIPVYMLAAIPLTFGYAWIVPNQTNANPELIFQQSYNLVIVILTLLNAIVIPFWQAIKAVIYYDLRGRREGLGLQLQERQ